MVSVKITTAVTLTAGQVSTIEKTITKTQAGSELRFEYVVDPQVVGGIKVMIGSAELDGTIRTKLTAIKNQLLTNL